MRGAVSNGRPYRDLTGTTTQVRHDVVCQAIVRGYEPVQLIGGITWVTGR